jgi:hypothetical protein
MSNDPYAAPETNVDSFEENESEIPDSITNKIRIATTAATISIITSAVVLIIGVAKSAPPALLVTFSIDLALMIGLGFGVYKKSRTAAAVLLVYSVLWRIPGLMGRGGNESTLASTLVFGGVWAYCYLQGVIGTVRYHNFQAFLDSAKNV